MPKGVYRRPSAIERFWTKVEVRGPDECWPYLGGCFDTGYGAFAVDRKNIGAHVFAWTLVHGPVPPGRCVLHRCDNPPCCNERHLFDGTNQDNQADKVSKGRQARGERHGNAVLTDAQVVAIRKAEGENQHTLAAAYGVAQSTIWRIQRGHTRASA